MSRRLQAALIAAAVAVLAAEVAVTYVPGPAPPLIFVVTTTAVGASFLVAGIAAWQRWPASRLGLLFTIAGYAWLLPQIGDLPYALAFTIGNLSGSIYAAALAHLALAWPTGRLRSRFECGVVIAVYAWNTVQSLVSMLFWNPRTSGCPVGCPANLLLVNGRSIHERLRRLVRAGVDGDHRHRADLDRPALAGGQRLVAAGHDALLWVSFAAVALSVAQTLASNLNLPVPGWSCTASPRWYCSRPGAVRGQHGAGADGARRGRHRDC